MSETGFILLHKIKGVTSFQALRPVKQVFRGFKIGHAGTLDQDASGLLVVGVGTATRMLSWIEGATKTYEFILHLGVTTDTLDATGEESVDTEFIPTSQAKLESVVQNFLGAIEQIPPQYSALKINGKRASDLVRQGQEVELKSRSVQIFTLEILEEIVVGQSYRLKCVCSKGTYIRSLGRDIGFSLGTIAYVSDIHRTQIGKCMLDDADEPCEDFQPRLKKIQDLIDLPRADFSPHDAKQIRLGMNLAVAQGLFVDGTQIFAFEKGLEDTPISCGEIQNNRFYPRILLSLGAQF